MARRIALIMAGGGGTRLWPASTKARPKQVMPGLPHAGTTLVTQTLSRLDGLVAVEDCFVVTTSDQVTRVSECLPQLPQQNIIVEPMGRNTAPCVALALLRIQAQLDSDEHTLVILPADHHIDDDEEFRIHLSSACARAEASECIVTLGIEPTRPDTWD